MDHRSPLKDLTSLNIPAIEIPMDKVIEGNTKKPRFSVIQAFDPLYDSPQRKPQNISTDSSNNSSSLEIVNDKNDENINPFSTLIDVSDISSDISIDDVRQFTEEIIDEALDNIFALKAVFVADQQVEQKDVFTKVKYENADCGSEVLDEKSICDNKTSIAYLYTQLEEKDEKYTLMKEQFLKSQSENNVLNVQLKILEEHIIAKTDQIDDNVKTIGNLEILLKSKDENLAQIEQQILEIKPMYQQATLKLIECQDAKEQAETNIIKLKEELQVSQSKTAEDVEKRTLQEKNTKQELQALVTEKDAEISVLNKKLLQNEDEFAKLETKIQEYDDILESYGDLFKKQIQEVESLREENQMAKKHLSNQEIAFGDVYEKYERCKRIIEGYKANEEILKNNLSTFQDTLSKYERHRTRLQEEADFTSRNYKKELGDLTCDYKTETSKLLKKIRQLEIRNASLASTLQQKTVECQELTELCQEITEK